MDHPNIIKIFGSEFRGEEVFIFLEYASQGDLYSALFNTGRPPISLRKKIRIFIQCVQALGYMHDQGILHRDLKLENILLTNNYDVRLCDFGWAIEEKHPSRRRSMCGTVEYMAPEVFQRKPHTSKIDIWALGGIRVPANF